MVTLVRALINNRINLKVRGGTRVFINSPALFGFDCNDKSAFCRDGSRTISFLCRHDADLVESEHRSKASGHRCGRRDERADDRCGRD